MIGLLQIGHRQADRAYRTNELQLGQTLVAQVDVAVENALQFQKTEAALFETEQQTKRLAQLNRMTQALALIHNEAEIFDIAAMQVTDIFAGDRGSICLVTEDKAHFTILALRGNEAIKLGAILPIAETMVGTAIRENRVVIASNFEEMRHLLDLQQLQQQGLRSSMAAPLPRSKYETGTSTKT